jgi:glycosyltransferase involved in cell wall biosynthesis
VTAPGARHPLSVLHIDTERGWRGGERQLLWLAEALRRVGHRSLVAARPDEPLAQRALASGLDVHACAPSGELDLRAVRRLRRLISRECVDVVHAHTAHAVALGALATLALPVPLVLTRRVDFPLRRNVGTRWKYARAAAIIAISRAVARVLEAGGIEPARITVVPDGVDLARRIVPASRATLDALGLPVGAPIAVQVSALVDHKDPVTFVRAVAVARHLVPGLHALIVGDGARRADVEGAVSSLGLTGTVHVTGYRTDADSILAAADVATLSSKEEGMGSVLIDAMAMGVPIVATRAGGIPEVVRDGETALLAPVGDADALGRHIARVVTDRALAARMSEAGLRRATEFSIERTASLTIEVYARVLGDSTRARYPAP